MAATSKHSPDLRMQACATYLATGDSRQASRLTGIPDRTIRSWFDQDWWIKDTERLRAQFEKQLDAKLTAIIGKAMDVTLDRLENGDELIGKDGAPIRRKVSGRDAAVIGGVAFDKRALIRGQPTSRVERVNLDELRRQFAGEAVRVDGVNESGDGAVN